MSTELQHEHVPAKVPAPFLDPLQPQNLRDDEIELIEVCVICAQVIESLPVLQLS